MPTKHVLNMHDVSNIWKVPLVMEAQGAHESICAQLNLPGADRMNLSHWKSTLADRWDNLESSLTIAMVGKYTGLSDAYLSVIKALQHACLAVNRRLDLAWVDAEKLEDAAKADEPDAWAAAHATLASAHGVLVPGGFGSRGVEGKILAAKYAREAGKPYLGICLGMQLAVVEFARNVLGLADANSAEFDAATPHPAVVFMPEGSTTHKGGTMRLGARRTVLETVDCISAKLYQAEQYVNERHRHRYEVNPTLVPDLEAKGLKFVGKDETGQRMEIVELQVRRRDGDGVREERSARPLTLFSTHSRPVSLLLPHNTGPPLLRGRPVPPGVQVPAQQAVPAVPRPRPGRVGQAGQLAERQPAQPGRRARGQAGPGGVGGEGQAAQGEHVRLRGKGRAGRERGRCFLELGWDGERERERRNGEGFSETVLGGLIVFFVLLLGCRHCEQRQERG